MAPTWAVPGLLYYSTDHKLNISAPEKQQTERVKQHKLKMRVAWLA